MNFKCTLLSWAMLAILSATQLNAQVTIGSSEKPVFGAILQLKQNPNVGENSTRGLAMPRVKLTNPTSLTDIVNAVGKEIEHTGLTVYATDRFGTDPINCPGLYVWDGAAWQPVGNTRSKPDITMTDGDGNVYNARWFSADVCNPNAPGAYWTRSNLYTTKLADGTPLSDIIYSSDQNKPILNAAVHNSISSYIVINSRQDLETGTIPSYGVSTTPGNVNIINQSRLEYAKEYGLLYMSMYFEGGLGNIGRKICAEGWHISTDEDWENLIAYHGDMAGAKMRKPSSWKKWYTSSDGTTLQWGQQDGDTPPNFLGFDAVPAGVIGCEPVQTQWFGYGAFFGTPLKETYRILNDNPDSIFFYQGDCPRWLSVRCVKD